MANSNEGTTPALSDEQARRLLETPVENTLKGVRDRAFSPSPMKPILPRSRNGLVMRMFRRSASTIGARPGRRTPGRFEFDIELLHQVVEKMQTARLECGMPCLRFPG